MPRVTAEVHSDDHAIRAVFDAAPILAQCSDRDIEALAAIDWGGDQEADDIAREARTSTPDVEAVFAYLATEPHMGGQRVGFECHLDMAEAEAWARAEHPALAARLIEPAP